MGKQWLLNKMTGDSSTTDTKPAGKSRKSRNGRKHNTKSSSGTGCMNVIFHLFDIQNNHFPFHQPSFISQSSINIPLQENSLKGVEAPRNSLELEQQEHMVEELSSSSSSSSNKLKQETNNFNIPMGGIQIKTKRTRLMEQDNNISSSECSSSSPAGSKTPNLVARLMGLDLLPENSSPRPSLSSPRPSSSSSHATPLNQLSKLSLLKNNTRSLPGTPRISTAARPSTEIDYHHRLSLQNSKENKRRYDESSSEYAKQIAKQVRENISRRVGADITNIERKKEQRRDEFLVVLKPKRLSPPSSTATAIDKSRNLDQGNGRGKENEPIKLSSSPRLRLLEMKNNLNKTISNLPKTSPLSSSTEVIFKPSSSTTTKSLPLVKEQVQVVKHDNPLTKVQKCKKIASEKYDLRLKKMHQQEDQFMKKCNKKSTTLSKHLVNVNTTTKFISFKKDVASHPSTTTLPQTQVPCITQLPNCQNRSYNTKKTHNLTVIDDVSTNGSKPVTTTTTAITGSSFSDHFEFISKILCHSGIEKTTPISITHWYSRSHPLHPSIFQHMEKLYHPTTTTNLATRKLVFDVTNELLVQILKPYISFKPWVLYKQDSHQMFGSELIEKLCEKIRRFPNVDCKVLEDIDGLIENDMNGITRLVGKLAFEEEAEELVAELERDMVDTLVDEVARIIWHVGC